MSNEKDSALQKAWERLKAPVNETVTNKWYFEQAWQACEKRLLLSRVVGPEKKCESWDTNGQKLYKDDFDAGFNQALDALKLLPISLENIISEEEILHFFRFDFVMDDDSETSAAAIINFIKEQMRKRLCGEGSK
jgi:hypothetical protein